MSHFTPQVVTSQHCRQLIVVWKLIIALNHFLYPMSCRLCFHARVNSRDTNHVQWLIVIPPACCSTEGVSGEGTGVLVFICSLISTFPRLSVHPADLHMKANFLHVIFLWYRYSMHYHRYCTVPAISANVCARVSACVVSASASSTHVATESVDPSAFSACSISFLIQHQWIQLLISSSQ